MSLIGKPAPDFELPNLSGHPRRLSDGSGRVLVMIFWSLECEWSRRAGQALAGYQADWGEAVEVWTIACNPQEDPGRIAAAAGEDGLKDVLIDGELTVTRRYTVEITPHLFVVDAVGIVRYSGAFDDRTFRQRTATRHYLQEAVAAVLAGRQPDPAETPPYGCVLHRI